MKKKVLLVLIGLILTLTLAFSPIVSAKSAAVLPGGVGAGPQFHWRYQSGTTASSTSYWLEEEWCRLTKLCTQGRVMVDLLPVNSMCTSYETLDATMTGVCEMASS